MNSLRAIENEQVNHKQQLDTWKAAVSRHSPSPDVAGLVYWEFTIIYLRLSHHRAQVDQADSAVGPHETGHSIDLTWEPQIQNQADTIAQLRQENIHWKDQYARVEKSCQEWKEQFMRVEQERIRLLARLEEVMAQRDSVSLPTRSSGRI